MAANVGKEKRFNSGECKQGKDGEREQPQLSAQKERQLKSQHSCIQSLVHSTHCQEGNNCLVLRCAEMKRAVEHTKKCRRKTSGSCHICQDLIRLCCYHAKNCYNTATQCAVPYCHHIKLKLRQQRLAQLQTIRRLIATKARQRARPQMPNQEMQPGMTGPGVQAQPEVPSLMPGSVGQPQLQPPTTEMEAQVINHED